MHYATSDFNEHPNSKRKQDAPAPPSRIRLKASRPADSYQTNRVGGSIRKHVQSIRQ